MNKRMLELYKQAHVPTTHIDPSNNMPYAGTCFSAEKFSKLIVRECMEQIYMQSRGPCGDNHGEWYESDILKHFGVEE